MMTGETTTWDIRLVRGMAGMGASAEITDALVTVLGALGCEAEYGLSFLFVSANVAAPTPAQGEMWLRQCFQLGQRLTRLSTDLEVALQAYLDALVAVEPALANVQDNPTHSKRASNPKDDSWIARFDATPDVWWPERGEITVAGEPIELWLRRAGFAYRHTVTVGLPGHVETLTDMLGLILHALQTLPPRGVLTRESLYLGLQALATEVVGDLVPHHISDIDGRHIGLLSGIATIMRLAAEPAPIDGDIIWARGELGRARLALQGQTQGPRAGAGGGHITRPLAHRTGNLWARQLIAEWERTVAQLTAIRQEQQTGAHSH